MKKVLLALKNLSNSKDLFNFITLKYSTDIHIVGFSDDTIETMSLIFNYSPDVIFIDSESFLKLRIDLLPYYPIYYIDDEAEKLKDYPYGLSYLSIYENFSELFKSFKNKQRTAITRKLEQKITKQLKELNFNFKQSGTRYFLETLIYVYENKNSNALNNVSKNIYPIISNKYHTSICKVKWNIEKSIKYMYDYNNRNFPGLIEEYLDFEFSQKPTTKELIILLNRLL